MQSCKNTMGRRKRLNKLRPNCSVISIMRKISNYQLLSMTLTLLRYSSPLKKSLWWLTNNKPSTLKRSKQTEHSLAKHWKKPSQGHKKLKKTSRNHLLEAIILLLLMLTTSKDSTWFLRKQRGISKLNNIRLNLDNKTEDWEVKDDLKHRLWI